MNNQSPHKTYVLLTVDTEADLYQGQIVPFEHMVYCNINGEEYGIHRMMDSADKYKATMTFFTSVFEHRRMGIEAVKKVCSDIDGRGHEVQLHTHPNWIHDHRFMWGYSLEKQIDLIREGKETIYECIDKYPVAHRAGGFGSDENTLLALKENGLKVDSNYLFGSYSKLDRSRYPMNGVGEHHGIVEIPVTVFEQFHIGEYHPYRPFDINANSMSELLFVLNEAKRQKLPVVNLLMHSFSFVKRSKNREAIYPNLHDLRKFEKLLEYIHDDDELEVIGIGEYYDKLVSNQTSFPINGKVMTSGLIRTSKRACRYPLKGKANLAIVSVLAISFTLLISIVLLLVRS